MITRRDFLQATAAAAAVAATHVPASAQTATDTLFPGFKALDIKTSGATIHAVTGGSGPPVLLMHGYPQTHVLWHKVAPKLAERFYVVAADLRGYGDSSKPDGGEKHINYSKRAMALDMAEVMHSLGFDKFAVVGHDRGGRVAHRLAMDHADKVTRLATLDIVPTYDMFQHVNKEFATSNYHWFFLIQPAPLPETLIGNSVDFFLRGRFANLSPQVITPEAYAEYFRCFSNPQTIHATCEDYRAGASIDLEHDEADRAKKIACPMMALWSERGNTGRTFDVKATWQARAAMPVSGKALPGGHFLPEETTEQTLAELQAFLSA
ncbi:MAG: alpha/beta hydrolase [Acidobacteria bacterium]|nr:MAG: alpha/beta hydrolase [Acidobacteriota bacterium]